MKLTTTTQVSVDGVMQGNGPSEVERMAGFERDGWAMGHFDSEAMTFVEQLYQRADAFLFGRWTYDFFAGYWGIMDLGSGPIADALNTRPKYVASNTLTEPRWADTTVLSGDLAAAIGEPKATPGGELQVRGSGRLVRWLLENDLVDEMNLLVVPVVVGQGTRLVPGYGPDIALDLTGSRAFPKGMGDAPDDRLAAEGSSATGVPESLVEKSGTRCRIRAEVFVARVSGRPRGPRTTGDDPRCSTWVP